MGDHVILFKQKLALLSLCKGSKMNLVFKDIADLKQFFDGMGVEKLLEDQPSSKEIMEEIRVDSSMGEAKHKLPPFVAKLEDALVAHGTEDETISLKVLNSLLIVNFKASGFKEIHKYLSA